MANTFELTNTYINAIKEYRDETTPLSKVLESSQNILFHSYLSRRNNPKTGYFEEEIAPFIFLRYYIGEGKFILCDLNAYKEGWHSSPEVTSFNNEVSSPVLSLLDDSVSLINNDDLSKSLESYPTFTDWFKRLLDKIPSLDRQEISLNGVKVKKLVEVIEEEKKKLEEEETSLEEKTLVNNNAEQKTHEKVTSSPAISFKKKEKKAFIPKNKDAKKVKVKTATLKNVDEFEEKKLIASQSKANELSSRIKKKIGIHFGWDELFVYAKNGDEMLTSIDKKIRKKGLKDQDNDWIIVATYTVEDDDFEMIKLHHPNHTYRSDDILHKPSAEYVSLAIVVSPVKEERKAVSPEVKSVKSKAVSFVNVVPEVGYSASEDLDYDDDFEQDIPEIKHPNDGIVRPVKYKGAIFASHADQNSYHQEEDEDDSAPEGTYSNPNGEYGIQQTLSYDEESEVEVPKRWKCPYCPSKNQWHAEEPSRIIRNSDGSYTFLCKKHKNKQC